MDQDCGGHKCPLALRLRKHGPLRLGRVIAGELKAVVTAAALFAGVFSPLFAASAQAGIGFPAEIRRLGPPIERVQYFTLGGDDYCWYSDGWNGPGWYECGDQEIYGFGWGGANGWNGWGGGDHIRRHGYHGVGVYHPGRQPVVGDALGVEGGELEPRRTYEGLPHQSRVPVRPSLAEDVAPDRPRPGTLLEARHTFGHEDMPRYSDFGAPPRLPDAALPIHGLSNSPAPVFHTFGGGDGLQDFGFHNNGGFHGPGIHAEGGIGGFAGFHPTGGGMFEGGHIGGIGHR